MSEGQATRPRAATLDAALALHRAGDLEGAVGAYAALLAAAPNDPNLLQLMGVALCQRGDRGAGILHMQRALAGDPGNRNTAENLAQAMQDAGRAEEATAILRRLVEAEPRHGGLRRKLAVALSLAGRHDDALALFAALLRAGMTDDVTAEAHTRALGRAGRMSEAIERLSDHLVANGVRFGPLVFLASLLADAGHLDDAAGLYSQAVGLQPDDVALRHTLVATLRRAGRYDEAFAAGLEALQRDPANARLHVSVGHVLSDAGHFAEALRHYEEAARLDSTAPEALSAAAWAAMRLERLVLAGNFAARALERDPLHADAYLVLATLASDLGSTGEAIRLLEEARAKGVRHAQLSYKYADTIIAERQRLADGLAALDEALEIEPGHYSAWLRARDAARHLVRHDKLEELGRHRPFSAEERRHYTPAPFLVLMESDDPAEHLAHSQRFWERTRLDPDQIFTPSKRPQPPPPPGADEPIVVGYLSSDYHEHATAYLLSELFELHDRRRFRIHAYCYSPESRGPMRQRIKRGVDHFISVKGLSHGDTAATIARNGVHVLVDLKGWTAGSHTPVMGLRPAPIQVSWLGYPGSTGGEAIDYFVSDRVVTPEGADADFAEHLVRLPGCYQINDRRRRVDPIRPTRAAFDLPETAFVYASFNQPYKVTPDLVASWSRILAATPGSVLWLFAGNGEAAVNLPAVFAAHGIGRERIVASPGLDNPKHLARLPLADLCLDTFPVGSHTTASDALWMGVPVLTRPGRAFPSRVAASLLHAVELPELVAADEEHYERLAVALARGPARLGRMRRHLTERRESLPLFDTPRFVAGLEAAYVAMVERWRAGLPPDRIDI